MEHTPVRRWCSLDGRALEPKLSILQVKKLHVYDFDNTLFRSPNPNEALYTSRLYGSVMQPDTPQNVGGWWDNPYPLEVAAKLLESSDDPYLYWNKRMLNLAALSNSSPDTLSIILTGRKENRFKDVFQDILAITLDKFPELEISLRFNAVCLKKFRKLDKKRDIKTLSTLKYKTDLLEDFLKTYHKIEEVTIYDDRINQVNSFKSFFSKNANKKKWPQLKQWFIVPVPPECSFLPVPLEVKFIQYLISEHNKSLTNTRKEKRYSLLWTHKRLAYGLRLRDQISLLSETVAHLKNTVYKNGQDLQIKNLANKSLSIPITKLREFIWKQHINDWKGNLKLNGGKDISAFLTILQKFYDNPSLTFEFDFCLHEIGIETLDVVDNDGPVSLNLYLSMTPTGKNKESFYTVFNRYLVLPPIDTIATPVVRNVNAIINEIPENPDIVWKRYTGPPIKITTTLQATAQMSTYIIRDR
ncbi:uncharacterized protein KNAG_0J00380 [Huiozyma naganishii CBS 8797]|uniref:Uncharacterized protein n=1 Tax=Huiozyma naganishii (strain ATCC MYA-139 / BCRC 22969 / CBS 8797 / KCTC 17520 / NBRC 10181 / NCYC 3082 / Yp74L-3) TaxID=1071383 RepID=J7SAF6_HUIN7|nr:hypothetical protein KNAG_0J00380 [Kazachstania naganishii CBS 8797]CCK72121.1 hypothetical protein KNAG_0J00380 [Kazachstania naganishii CBS 8797]